MSNTPVITPLPGPVTGPVVQPPAPATGAPTPITLSPSAPPVTNQAATVVVTVNPAPAVGTVLTFTLQVTDDIGGVSPVATFPVTVRALPTASLTGPQAVPAGATIPLTGTGTPGGGGKIVSYTWTLKSVTPPNQ